MHIRFGMALDGEHSWERRNAVNDVSVGPLGLLSILETQLGLLAPRPSNATRAIQFRDCLKRSDTGNRFYSASFAADDIGTAATLLDWRDTLILHGWNGTFAGDHVPARLRDMEVLEQGIGANALAPCIGERLTQVARRLTERECHVAHLAVLDAKECVPARWQVVLGILGATYAEAPTVSAADANTFLGRLQHSLMTSEPTTNVDRLAWQDDGSVAVYCAETQVAAAQWLAGFLADLSSTTLVVNESNGALLDDTLAAFGAARAGLDEMSAFRPALQVLPLALKLLWKPLNVMALLAFLSLPNAPIRRAYRRHLARAVANSPGINGPAWKAALTSIKQECQANGHDTATVLAEIKTWTQPATWSTEECAPIAALRALAAAVKAFFQMRLGSGDAQVSDIHHAGFAQCAAFEESLDELVRQGETRMGPNQVDRLLEEATSHGTYNPQRVRQVGSVLTARGPAAVCESVETIVWFWATHPQMPARTPWTLSETEVLAESGVCWPSQSVQLAWQGFAWLQPILRAGKRLVLILPSCKEEAHPVWHTLCAAVRPPENATGQHATIPVRPLEQILENQLHGTACTAVPHLALPAPRRWWHLAHAVPKSASAHSYKSLDLFIRDPSQWVMRYPAALQRSNLVMADGNRLYGLLAHRLCEKMVEGFNAGTLTARDVPGWCDRTFPALVREEGAVLHMPGRSADLIAIGRTIKTSMGALAQIIESHAPVHIDAEHALAADFEGGALQGNIDLLLHLADGSTAVVDMKWAREKIYCDDLALGTHLQLVLYAHAEYQRTQRWPALAYFIIASGRLHAADTGPFKGIVGIRKSGSDTTPALWQRFLANYRWRAAQLTNGLIEAACAGKPTDDSVMPPDGMKVKPPEVDWNDHKNLVGWEA